MTNFLLSDLWKCSEFYWHMKDNSLWVLSKARNTDWDGQEWKKNKFERRQVFWILYRKYLNNDYRAEALKDNFGYSQILFSKSSIPIMYKVCGFEPSTAHLELEVAVTPSRITIISPWKMISIGRVKTNNSEIFRIKLCNFERHWKTNVNRLSTMQSLV